MRDILISIVILLVAFINTAQAKQMHGLSMHGNAKYNADYTHLEYANPDAPKGGRIKHGVMGSFDSLNNHIINGTSAKGLELIYDKLMARVWDEPFTLYGLVAESIDIPDDRSSITFHLRPEARFHDGKQMTVEDVIFSYETYRKYGHPVRRRVYSLVNNVEKIDNLSVKFTFGDGYDPETALILAMMPVLPKHYWEKNDVMRTTLEPPLGSGPYLIKSIEAGRKITYERVKDYWAKDLPINKGHHNFDVISYDYYRDDGVSLEAFKSGEYDLRREQDIKKWITGYDFAAIQNGAVKKEELKHNRPEWVRSLIFNTRRFPFDNRKVREALIYAFDFEWINKNLFHNSFKRINSFFPNSELAATGVPIGNELSLLKKYRGLLPEEVFMNAYVPPITKGTGPSGQRKNLRKATTLLKEAGWVIKDSKLTHIETGRFFEFEILLSDPKDEKIALEFIRVLKRLGINARVRTVSSAEFAGRLDGFDYDMTLFRWINSLSPGNEQMNYWGSAAANLNGSRNYAGVRSSIVDEIADSIARAPTREDLVNRTHALDRVLTWGYYTIPLYYLGHDLVAYNTKLRHPDETPLYGMVVETWWQEKKK